MTFTRDCLKYSGTGSKPSCGDTGRRPVPAVPETGSVEFVRPKPRLSQYRPEQTRSDDLSRVHRHRDSAGSRRVRQVRVPSARPSDGVTQASEPLNQLPRRKPRQPTHPATSTATWYASSG